MIDYSEKTPDELRIIAKELGLKPHHKASAETIIKQIKQQGVALQNAAVVKVDDLRGKAEMPVAPIETCTKDQVERACASYFARPDFHHEFIEEDDGGMSWVFRKGRMAKERRGYYHEDTGSMSMPLRKIVQKAAVVAAPIRISNTYTQSQFDSGDAPVNSAFMLK